MKRAVLLLFLFASACLMFAQVGSTELLLLNRKAASNYYGINNDERLLQSLPAAQQIYYSGKDFLLIGGDNKLISELPSSAYTVLGKFPLQHNWFILTRIPGRADAVTPAMGTEVIRTDEVILLKTWLDNLQLGKFTALPYVKINWEPIKRNALLHKAPSPTRIDFGSLLTEVNADSIHWFVQQLQDFQTRYAGAPNRQAVANWIRDQFLRFGMSDAHTETFQALGVSDEYNVVATIPGALAPNKFIVMGGHHDSTVNDGNNPAIFAPGADDNASGTAAVLEIARVMKASNYQPECTIRFVTYAAEEWGLFGSQYDAQQCLEQNRDIKLMINHDMISNSSSLPGEWQVVIQLYEGSFEQAIYAAQTADAQTDLGIYYMGYNSAGSDSYNYWLRGYPAIFWEEYEFSPYYHSINDLAIHSNSLYEEQIVIASTATCVSFDQMPSAVDTILVADTGTGNSLQVSWNSAAMEPDVTTYTISLSSAAMPDTVYYFTSNPPYIITGLTNGTEYTIGVTATDSQGNTGLETLTNATPYLMPQTPQDFADHPQMNSVNLTWTPNNELDIAGYRIYRSTALDGPYSQLNASLATGNTYTDDTGASISYYYYKLAAVDQTANESPLTDPIRTRGVTLNHGILIVDETINNPSNTVFSPNDEVSDLYFDNVMHNFSKDHFDTQTEPQLKLADIGIYSSILWHGNDAGTLTYPLAVRDQLAQYLALGGKILITTYFPTRAFDNNTVYPTTFENGNYLYDVFGIGTAAFITSARFRYAQPLTSNFPALEVDTLKTIPPLHGHIYNIESVGSASSNEIIYYYGSDYDSSVSQGFMNGYPVGVYHQSGNSKSIVLSFPLFNMKQDEVTSLMYYVFHDLYGETVANEDPADTPSASLAFGSIFPNPFNERVNLEITGIKTSEVLNASIYNLKGQKIRTLYQGISANRQVLSWDGRNGQNKPTAASIYFLKVEQDGKVISHKIIRLR